MTARSLASLPSRRRFLAVLAGGVTVLLAPRLVAAPAPAPVPARSPPRAKRTKTFVLVFQRGAVDGLSMVLPYADANYAAHRPTLAIPAPGKGDDAALPLDATFALHPALAPLRKHWDARRLAVVHGVGSPDPTRSHFDAQDFVESGTPGVKSTDDGWLNRLLVARSARAESQATPSSPALSASPLHAVAIQPELPRILSGSAAAVAFNSLRDLRVSGDGQVAGDFQQMYGAAVDQALRGTAHEAFAAMASVQSIKDAPPPSTATYPSSPLGHRLQTIAQLVRGNAGVEVAVTECGGWDTHAGQGGAKGQLAGRLRDLAESLDAFATDLGDRLDDVCLVTVTEFGRTVKENGTKGTDHGHGSVMFVLGGKVRGKRVVAKKWGGLGEDQLWQGRDLPVTTDHRDVFAEVLCAQAAQAGAPSSLAEHDLRTTFPGFAPAHVGLFA
jgi:uncharacterized protein (DUF1501 family)